MNSLGNILETSGSILLLANNSERPLWPKMSTMGIRYVAPRFYIMPVTALWQANQEGAWGKLRSLLSRSTLREADIQTCLMLIAAGVLIMQKAGLNEMWSLAWRLVRAKAATVDRNH